MNPTRRFIALAPGSGQVRYFNSAIALVRWSVQERLRFNDDQHLYDPADGTVLWWTAEDPMPNYVLPADWRIDHG